jgi:hypothetical protein
MYGSEQCLLKKNVRNIVAFFQHYQKNVADIVGLIQQCLEHCALYCTKHCLDNMGTLSLDCHLKKNVCLSNIVEKNNLKKIVYFHCFFINIVKNILYIIRNIYINFPNIIYNFNRII